MVEQRTIMVRPETRRLMKILSSIEGLSYDNLIWSRFRKDFERVEGISCSCSCGGSEDIRD